MRVLLVCLFLVTASCSDPPVGSPERPFTMYFVPSVDAEGLATRSAELKIAVERYVSQKLYGTDTGFHVETAVPASYIAVVEAFGTNRADFAAFNTFAYVLTRDVKGYDIEPMFTIARGMHAEEATYCGQIIARADSGIESVEDLAGKRFAYVDPASTSGFILPRALLHDRGIEPSEVVFGQKHDNVVTMVYQGQVDAGATYFSPPARVEKDGETVWAIRDARMRVLTQFPDVEEKVRIVTFTEEVPNEPWVIRSTLFEDPDLNARVKQYIKEALQEFATTEEGKQALWTVATGTGLVPATQETYDKIRNMILEANPDFTAALGKKGWGVSVILDVQHLSKVYDDGHQALRDVSFEVREGEFLAVIGLSGAGKSTLIRCINRLVDPSYGTVIFRGTDVTALPPKQLRAARRKIGMVFQHFNLVERRSVLTNVLSGRLGRTPTMRSLAGVFTDQDKQDAHRCLATVGLEEKARNRADELSGGQKQRVAIARALMQEPDLLLADEPVASLDPATAHSVLDYLRKANEELGVTILCNLHFLSLVREYASRVLALRQGELVYDGGSERIDRAWFKRIYGEDAREISITPDSDPDAG